MAGYIDFVPVGNGTPKQVSGSHPLPVTLETSGMSSLFSEVITTSRTPIIELNSAYGTSLLRDVLTTANGGTITQNATDGTIVLSSGTTANGSAHIDSAEVGRYIPGYAGGYGIGIRIPTAPTGNTFAEWGCLDSSEDNGFLFGQDATGAYVEYRKGGVSTKVYQSDWNVDRLDGTGASGITLDTSIGYIYQVDYSWYGYALIQWSILAQQDNNQSRVLLHQFKPENSTSIANPNLRIHAKVDNGGDTTNLTMDVGGRQYSVYGRYVPKFRFSGQTRVVNTSGTLIPTVSFRAKSAFTDRSLRVEGFTTLVASADVEAFVILNGTLTNASYGTPSLYTAAETAVEVDTSATAISGGVVIWSDILIAGQGHRSSLSAAELDIDIPQGQPVTLAIRTLANTGTAKVHFRIKEEW